MTKLSLIMLSLVLCNLSLAKIIPTKINSHKKDNQESSPVENNNQTEQETNKPSDQNNIETDDGSKSEATELKPANKPRPSPVQFTNKLYPALGFDTKLGPLWSIVCITKEWGRIPGKLTSKGKAFFTYDYSIYYCDKYFKVNGKMIWNDGTIPKNCLARGKQNDNSKPLYNVLAVTQYGNIPGKASSPLEAIFSIDAIRHSSKDFYWIC